MKVAKFGGSSLANAEQIKKVCNIITSDSEREVIVVSAPGKRHKDDTKVTDLLIVCAEKYLATGSAEEEVEAVLVRYREIAAELGLSKSIMDIIEEDIQQRLAQDTTNPGRFMDSLKVAGEDNCAKLVAE